VANGQTVALCPQCARPLAGAGRTDCRIIKEFGFINPILAGADGVIVAGHGRLAAARKLALTQVPVIELGHLTVIQKKAYTLADNRIAANAGWDEEC